jgi:regulator of sigma E protease
VSWLIVILGFCVLVVLHELGHFTVAKAVGMRVEKFSLFFPPTIWSRKKGETEYAIGAIPAGGYVRISGMNPSEDLPDDVRDRAYHAQPVWKRMAVIAAGPLVNFILAFVLLLFAFAVYGPRVPSTVVDATAPGKPAAKVLRHGDRLVAVDGKRPPATLKSDDRNIFFANLIAGHTCAGGVKREGCEAAHPVRLTVDRGGKLLTFSLLPRYDTKNQPPRMRVGFTYAFPRHPYSFGKAVDETASQFWFITRETVKIPSYIFNAQKRKEISGIVGTSDAANKAVSNDAADAIALFAVISLSLAIINLFPFLPLDGGHIFWAFVEWVRRRPVPYAVMERAGVIGFMLVIGLFLLGLTNDIDRLTNGTGVR